jgi:hypothetical protein
VKVGWAMLLWQRAMLNVQNWLSNWNVKINGDRKDGINSNLIVCSQTTECVDDVNIMLAYS